MIIYHNMSSLYVWRKQHEREYASDTNLERLSSGVRINSAKDDASGLAVAEKMVAQIRGLC
jgi:flagellin